MRGLVAVLLVVAASVAAAWFGGETWLAREAARRIADDPRIAAAQVAPLRDLRRIGLHLADVTVATAAGDAALPTLDLWAAPSAPTEFHAALPERMILPIGGVLRPVQAAGAGLSARISPASRMAVSRAALSSGPVTIDGAPLAAAVQITAALSALGPDAPAGAAASYAVQGQADGVAPPAGMQALQDAGLLSASGAARVFLTGPVVPGESRPQVVGLASDGLTVRLGSRAARVTGRLAADAEGRATGAIFVYTRDVQDWLALAAETGLLPKGMVALAGTALAAAAGTAPQLPPGIPPPAEPQQGELRIPLLLRGGQAFLGPLPVGPAPIFPR
ncbi:DUF2125 domain-containing protein [Paracoccus contaminans]|uniref:DUF2125 domain-containing protein n=1 Tax=Paracoccus contaminans TaxID=1945662 RepID=A0A1W6CU22_9RHOB|nr:DUF2125 domain-containing protein [Paracoccus contaminans]ARJ68373.1 hypothetical protein B0A89_00595 [Paracoccus contaminans]